MVRAMDANILKQLRRERGWSQAELARKSGLHFTTISMAEHRGYQPGPRQMAKLAAAFGVSLGVLTGSEPDVERDPATPQQAQPSGPANVTNPPEQPRRAPEGGP
jgi:transcriptional regulator with XRE-family HTH domain